MCWSKNSTTLPRKTCAADLGIELSIAAGLDRKGPRRLLKDVETSWVLGPLLHHVVEPGHQINRPVEVGVAARAIAAHETQIARVFEAGNHCPELHNQGALLRRPGLARQARDRG